MQFERSPSEEIASAITHGLGVLLAIAGGTSLIVLSVNHAGAREVISAAVFTVTLVVMYVASTLYHAISQPRTKQRQDVRPLRDLPADRGYLYVGAGLSAPVRGWRARRKSAKTDAGFSKNLRNMLQDIDC